MMVTSVRKNKETDDSNWDGRKTENGAPAQWIHDNNDARRFANEITRRSNNHNHNKNNNNNNNNNNNFSIGHFSKYFNTLCFSTQILHNHCFCFLLGPLQFPRETGNNAHAKFGEDKQRVLQYFPEWPIT